MYTTLPQRLYLISYSVDKATFELTNLQGRGALLRAGALAELAITGQAETEGDKVRRAGAEPPTDAFLAAVWDELSDTKFKGWLRFVHNKAHTAERFVRDQLAETGELTLPEKNSSLRPLSSHKVTVNRPDQVRANQQNVRAAIEGEQAIEDIPLDVLALAVLPVEIEETSIMSLKEIRAHKETLSALAERFDQVVPGLRKALRDSFLVARPYGAAWGK